MSNVIKFRWPEKPKPPVCAFCNRPQRKDVHLIEEPGQPHICTDCLDICNKLLAEVPK